MDSSATVVCPHQQDLLRTGTAFSKKENQRWIGSAGGGIRYFYSLEHKGTLRLDYAIGEKRPGENRQSGFYLSISEAF